MTESCQKVSNIVIVIVTSHSDTHIQFGRVQQRRRAFAFAVEQRSAKHIGAPEDNPARGILSPKPVGTLASRASALHDESYQQVAVDQRRVASAVVLVGGQLWSSVFRQVEQMLQTGWQPVLMGKRRRYDETPLRVRVPERMGRGDASTSKDTGLAAKVLQTDFALWFLIHRGDAFLHMEGRVPTCLQVLENCTAPTIARAQAEIEELVPGLGDMAKHFPLRLNHPCTDKHPSNAAAEVLLTEDSRDSWINTHTFCSVHRVATTAKCAAAMIDGHISGVIAIAQSLTQSGSTRQLRKLLKDIIEDKLVVTVGAPKQEEYRNAVYDLTLSPVTTARSGKQAQFLKRKQRFILNTFLNGDVQREDLVEHCCTTERTKAEVMKDITAHVIPSLVPHACPMINRGSFLGHESALRWVGLLALTHNLLEPLILRFCGPLTRVQPPMPQQQQPPQQETSRSWRNALSSERAQLSALSPLQDFPELLPSGRAPTLGSLDEDAGMEAAVPQQDDGDVSWDELKRATRRKARLYVESKPAPKLALILVSLQPAQMLTRSFIQISSERWDAQQRQLAASGQPRSYRALELFRGRLTQGISGQL